MTDIEENAKIAGLLAQRDFYKATCDELTLKISQMMQERHIPVAAVADTDALLEHIVLVEAELALQKARAERMCEHAVECKTARDRIHKRLLEVVAERDELRRRK